MNALLKALFLNRNLGLLWVGQIIAKFGESLFMLALPFLALELTGSSAITGLVQMFSYLPILLFGLFAGAYIDRTSRRAVMLIADLARGVLVLLVPMLFFLNLLSAWWLAAVAFAISAFSAFFVPARNAAIPELVTGSPYEREVALLKANSLVQTSEQIAFLLAPLAVGVLAQVVMPAYLLGITALTFFASYFFIWAIALPAHRASSPFSLLQILTDTKASLQRIQRNVPLRGILIITSLNNLFLMGAAVIATPALIKKELGRGLEVFALIEFIFAVMMLLVGFLMNIFASRARAIGYEKIWAFGLIMDGFTYCPYYFCRSVEELCLYAAIHSAFIIFIIVPRSVLIQRLAPSEDLGKVFSFLNVAVAGMTALSSAATGWLCETIGIREAFLGIGIFAGLTGIAAWHFVAMPIRALNLGQTSA
ncbi:MAG: MFS transporter [Chloroherpetonaceae bacterium]|nr:MFS transporter [Chloroherpetonaceae bacterium]MCS7210077.1 MFS transporter [Chloroherpetonaceae bacterium]MDW8020263.1 MFS transporter [Chloroherpetonaceae bacterium]MDW8466550.1 MFS transporter [Chloroherpetonaceae bacterium]